MIEPECLCIAKAATILLLPQADTTGPIEAVRQRWLSRYPASSRPMSGIEYFVDTNFFFAS
jgi:hypothetical protein